MIGGSMGEYTGACLHCGQIGTSDYMGFDSQEQADEWATSHCNCSAAQNAREESERIDRAKSHIKELFGPAATDKGFPPCDEQLVEILMRLAELVGHGWIGAVSIKLLPNGSAKLSRSSKGFVKVSRTQDRACSLE